MTRLARMWDSILVAVEWIFSTVLILILIELIALAVKR